MEVLKKDISLEKLQSSSILTTISNIDTTLRDALTTSDIGCLQTAGERLSLCENVQGYSKIYQGAVLSLVRDMWDSHEISTESKQVYGDNYWLWANKYAHNTPKSTLYNRMGVYDYYYKNRNLDGGFMLPDDSITINNFGEEKKIPVQLGDASYSKLLAAKGTAIRSGLSPETTAALFDKNVSLSSLERHLLKDTLGFQTLEEMNNAPPEDNTKSSAKFTEMGGVIYYERDEDTVEALFIDPDYNAQSPVKDEGKNWAYERLGIKNSSSEPTGRLETPMAFSDDAGEINVNISGYSVSKLSQDRAETLFEELRECLIEGGEGGHV